MPCTVHPKKGWLPEFRGYSRKQEETLLDYALCQLMNLLYFKRKALLFSDELRELADPDYEADTPFVKKKTKRRTATKKQKEVVVTRAAAPRNVPPRRTSPPSPQRNVELPASPASPFSSRGSSVVSRSPRSASKCLADYATFWAEDSDDN